jgi:uncharacterized membrane protein
MPRSAVPLVRSVFAAVALLAVPASALACVTCDLALQRALLDDRFLLRLLTIPVPLLLGGGLVALGVRRSMMWRERVAAGGAIAGPPPVTAVPVVTAGTLLGLGLGGFLDGILLHQVLQVHQMISGHVPPITVAAKNLNMFWDGMFHVGAWMLTAAGVHALWRCAGRRDLVLSTGALLGAALLGWGAFNLLDSVWNHYLFRYHAVVQASPRPELWNLAFLCFALLQIGAGAAIVERALRAGTNAPRPVGPRRVDGARP